MTTKRSPSPSADMPGDAPPAKELKTDHADSPPAGVQPDAGIYSGFPSPPSPRGGAAAEDIAAGGLAPTAQGGEGREQGGDSAVQRATVGIEELKTVRRMYEDGSLQGYDESEELAYAHNAELNDKIVLWRGDITDLEVDCIVNAANKGLLGGGGVDGAIHRRAGRGLYEECLKLNGAETGETKLTGGHKLAAKYIAHTVGPVYSRGKKAECEAKLRSCYKTTLDLCIENGIRTVAFSGISTGIYGYPLDAAAEVACDEVHKFLDGPDDGKIDKVIFCVFRQIDVNSYLDTIPVYFPPPPEKEDAAAVVEKGEERIEVEGAEEVESK